MQSIQVRFGTFSKKKNSTKRPAALSDLKTCYIKERTSIDNPTFILSGNNFDYNYAVWEDHYYFITDITSVHNNMVEVTCETDPLATAKDYILSSSQYVLRSASVSNGFILDGKYPALSGEEVEKVALPSLKADSTGCYIMGIVSGVGGGSTPAVTYYAFNDYTLNELMKALFDENYLDGGLADLSIEVQKELMNPFQYIVSCYWYPIPYTDIPSSAISTVYFGWWKAQYTEGGGVNTVVAKRVYDSRRVYPFTQAVGLPKHPQAAARGKFLNDSPFTRYALTCYSFGLIPFNPAPFVDSGTLTIKVKVDLFTGTAQLFLLYDAPDNGSCIQTATSQYGVPIQINQNTANVIGGIQSVITTINSAIRQNVVGAATGIVSAIESAFPQVQSLGTNGSMVAFEEDPALLCIFRRITGENNPNIGRPLCETRTLSSLTGYCECANAHVDAPLHSDILDAVDGYLNSGFYIE